MAALCCLLFGAVLVACSSDDKKTSKAPPPAENDVGDFPRVSMHVTTDGNTSLKLLGHSESESTRSCGGDGKPSDHVNKSSEDFWCLDMGSLLHPDVFSDFSYAIENSNVLVWGNSKVPLVGDNTVNCQIRKQGTTTEELHSPFGCRAEFTDASNRMSPKPKISVFEKPTVEVTNIGEATQLLNDNCGENQPGCTWKATSQKIYAAPQSKWLLYGSPQANCDSPNQPEQHSYGQSKTLTWSDQFGIKGQVKFGIGPVKATFDASYQHTVAESTQFQETHTQLVYYKKAGAFYIQPGYAEIVGDFLVAQTDKVYSIKNFIFDFPLGEPFSPDPNHPFQNKIVPGLVFAVSWDVDCPNTGTPQGINLPENSPPPPGSTVEGPAK